MTRDDIIRMAREAGFEFNSLGGTYTSGKLDEHLERFAALVAEAEREACAKTILSITNDDAGNPYKQALRIGAEAIRARGEK